MARHEDMDSIGADVAQNAGGAVVPAARVRSRRRRIALGLGVASVAGLGLAWFERVEIADNLVERELAAMGLPADYEIVRIGTDEQVVRNLVIGDLRHPDLTVDELRIATRLRFGWPGIGRITVVRPRLYGTFHDGKASFGTLDRVLFASNDKSEGPMLPDLDVAIVDGRGLIESDAGRIGLSVRGEGNLRSDFTGELGVTARSLALGDCASGPASLYGKLAIASGKPRLAGPLRLARLACAKQGFVAKRLDVDLDLGVDEGFDGGDVDFSLESGGMQLGSSGLAALTGKGHATYRNAALNARYELAARDLHVDAAHVSQLSFEGWTRAGADLATLQMEGDLSGQGIRAGGELAGALARAAKASANTFAGPLLAKLDANLARELPRSRLDARVVLRRSANGQGSLVVPQAHLKGARGGTLLALSRLQVLLRPDGESPQVTGNFATSGAGLPQLAGRMEVQGDGKAALRLSMADYAQGRDHLKIPDMLIRQDAHGNVTFTGDAVLGGAVPGGSVENFRMPLDGRWNAQGVLALWSGCTAVRFDRLRLSDLSLHGNRLSFCPDGGGPVLTVGEKGLKIAATMPALALAGDLGETPVTVRSGPVRFGWPGTLSAQAVDITMGDAAAPSRFAIGHIDAKVGETLAGTFDKTDVGLAAVPLDVGGAHGNWRFADGILTLDDAAFTLSDRTDPARFLPLMARGGTLVLEDGTIRANARLREPESDREVVEADIVHDLGSARGHADLTVRDLAFDDRLQPEQLAENLRGFVSLLKGSIHGNGRVDWNGEDITSHGRFASDGLDFAAPFGPVGGLAGDVVFTDLLGLVTAPDQRLNIASMNPGIEVDDGVLSFAMVPGHRMVINGATWPFMQGTLKLEPASFAMGGTETRRYTLAVEGLNAASLVERMEMGNVSASGVFDGKLPLVFDASGGRIEEGTLTARAPGGNVAYVGALSYEDLSAMGNYAFDALKSVDYKTMQVVLNGSLSGEIITQIRFSGITQGSGAKRNFLTKQIAKLPIRFVVNIKAPFFSLFGNMRSLYDKDYVADPRALGLVGKDGKTPSTPGSVAPIISIQPPVSEKTP